MRKRSNTYMEQENGQAKGAAGSEEVFESGVSAGRIPVLMYHRITNNKVTAKENWICVHKSNFEKQLRMLELWGFTSITFEDYELYLQGRIPLPRKPVIITIDDGYLDTYTQAFPLLKEYGMKAVVFVLGDRTLQYNKWDAQNKVPPATLMNKAQIQELQRHGFEIGAHTLSHPDLSKLSCEEAWEEIELSRLALKDELGVAPITFCYPYGGLTRTTKELVKKSGFRFACSVYSGPSSIGEDPYEIRRVTVRNNVAELALQLIVPQNLINGIKEALKKNRQIEIPSVIKNGERVNQVLPVHRQVGMDFRQQ